MQRILVATDFSARSDRALRRASLLAKQRGGEVVLVHVVDDDQPERLARAEREASLGLLGDLARTLREADGVDARADVVLGDPFDAIVRAIETHGADVAAIGAHRRRLLRDVFLGTTAERVVRESRRPVLVVNALPTAAYRSVLVAVDLGGASQRLLESFDRLGLAERAAVSAAHVFEAPAAPRLARAAIPGSEIAGYVSEEEQRAAHALGALLGACAFPADHKLLRRNEGSVGDTLCAMARDADADLVVVGTQARKGLAGFLLGSVAHAVLRACDRDVLAIPLRDDTA